MGPSCLIGPVICFFEKYFINGFPIKKTMVKDVTTDNPILNVMYLKTFKKESISGKFPGKKQSSNLDKKQFKEFLNQLD